jgi:hypothetical protein
MKMSYVCYSTASMNVLSHGSTIECALQASGEIDRDFLVVAKVSCPERLMSNDPLPDDAEIVWCGSNERAQRFRTLHSSYRFQRA